MTEETLKKANENRQKLEFWKDKAFKFYGGEEINHIRIGLNNCDIEHTEWGKHIFKHAKEYLDNRIKYLEDEFLRF